MLVRAEHGVPDTIVIGTAERNVDAGSSSSVSHLVTFVSALTAEALSGGCGGVEYRVTSPPASPSWLLAPRGPVSAPVLRVEQAFGRDERDLLDSGVDALVAARASTVDYARARAEFDIFPLAWDRVYVFLSAGEFVETAPPDLAESLARDAVPAGARVAEPPFAWLSDDCRMPTPGSRAGPRSSRVVYPGHDPVARAIAERLVALAGAAEPNRAELREFGALNDTRGAAAVALDATGLAAALERGSDLGYVLPLPRAATCGVPDVRWNAAVVPLIDTRAHLIVRAGIVNLGRDIQGRLRILPTELPR